VQSSNKYPWSLTEPLVCPLSSCLSERGRHISCSALQLKMHGHVCILFGCTEDVECTQESKHSKDYEKEPYMRTMCDCCHMPVCKDCWNKLQKHDGGSTFFDGGTIPMSMSNDHFYGYVNNYIVEKGSHGRSAQRAAWFGVLC